MIPIAGIAASKGKETAQALKNDVYVRKWTSVQGTGKKAVAVEHELHVNPTGILTGVAAGVAAAGVALVGGALALRFSGKKLNTSGRTVYFMIDQFNTPDVCTLLSKRGVPLGVFKGDEPRKDALNAAYKRSPGHILDTGTEVRHQDVIATHPATGKRVHATRYFYRHKVQGFGIEDKEEESWISKIFGIG